MPGSSGADAAAPTLDRSGYELEVDERFEGPGLDKRLWVPRYLPHWTTGPASVARYEVGAGRLVLRIDEDQPAWSPEYTGGLRVSSLQTGVYAGPKDSGVGQHRWRDGLVVREEQPAVRLYTPMYGLFELRARFGDDPTTMAALWMIGFEDEPERSAEICIVEIFGRDVGPSGTGIGMGVHPFHDPTIRDEFATVSVPIDAREPAHVRRGVDAPSGGVLRGRQPGQGRAPVARVPDAAHARRLRVPGREGRADSRGTVSEDVRRRVVTRLPAEAAAAGGERIRG